MIGRRDNGRRFGYFLRKEVGFMPMTFTWTWHFGKYTFTFRVRVSENRHPGR